MRKSIVKSRFLVGLVYLIIVGQLLDYGVSYYWLLQDYDVEHIEYCLSVDGESQEKDNKKGEDEKNGVEFLITHLDASKISARIKSSTDNSSIFHPKIQTPPPKFL